MKNKNIIYGFLGGVALGIFFYTIVDKKRVKTKKDNTGGGGDLDVENSDESIDKEENFQDRPTQNTYISSPKPLFPSQETNTNEDVIANTFITESYSKPILAKMSSGVDGSNFDLDVDLDV